MNIVVVEDNKSFQKGLKLYLEGMLKHNITCIFDNGKSFIDDINKCDYDVILMGINMPFMDGIDAAKHHDRFNTENNKIIAITLNYKLPLKILVESGFKGCIFKDEISGKLGDALTIVNNGGYYWSDRISLY